MNFVLSWDEYVKKIEGRSKANIQATIMKIDRNKFSLISQLHQIVAKCYSKYYPILVINGKSTDSGNPALRYRQTRPFHCFSIVC